MSVFDDHEVSERVFNDDEEQAAYDAMLAKYRRHQSALAEAAVSAGIRPIDVAGTNIGTGHGVLEQHYGKKKCDEYFFTFVEEMLGAKLKP